MIRLLSLTLLILSGSYLFGQNYIVASNGETIPTFHMNRGDSLFRRGEAKQAIIEYRLQNKEKYSISKYELACAYARDGQFDSSFRCLNLNFQYDHRAAPLINPDFLPMMDDPRWELFQNRWIDTALKEAPGCIKDIPLAKLLWKMFARDQAYYYELQILGPRFGDSTAVTSTFWYLKKELFGENERLLDSIIAIKGWPKYSQVGATAADAAFMVLQHSGFAKQEKYLPVVKALCEQHEADWESYAHLYDRVCYYKGKPQLYGTQIDLDKVTGEYSFYPIEDEANVNKRRAEMGMRPIEEYAKMMGFEYTPAK